MRLPEEVLQMTTKLEPDIHPSIARPEPSPVQKTLLKGFACKITEEALEKTARTRVADDWQASLGVSPVTLSRLSSKICSRLRRRYPKHLGMTLHLRWRDEYPFF